MIGTVVFSVLFGMTLVSTITSDEITPLHIILPPLFAILAAVSVWRTVARNIAERLSKHGWKILTNGVEA